MNLNDVDIIYGYMQVCQPNNDTLPLGPWAEAESSADEYSTARKR